MTDEQEYIPEQLISASALGGRPVIIDEDHDPAIRTLRGDYETPDPLAQARFCIIPEHVTTAGKLVPERVLVNEATILALLEHDGHWAGQLAWDELHREVVCTDRPGGEWDPVWETHSTAVAAWIQNVYRMNVSEALIRRCVREVADGYIIRPVYDYLVGLVWDGVPRLDTWLHRYLGAEDTALMTAYGRTWMVGAARRGLQPGCQCDHTLVLQGPQGARKTTVVRILSRAGVRLPMRAFGSMPSDVRDKDALARAGSTWIMEIGELDAMRKSERTAVKDYLTQTHDTYRGAYEAKAKTHARTCAFIGTTNDDTFLEDPTGSRRFWVVEVGAVDVDALSADVDQLWAEAVALVSEGVQPYLPPELEQQRAAANEAYIPDDEWLPIVAAWLDEPGTPSHVTAGDVLEGAIRLPAGQWQRSHYVRVAAVMRSAGWVAVRYTVCGRKTKGYTRGLS